MSEFTSFFSSPNKAHFSHFPKISARHFSRMPSFLQADNQVDNVRQHFYEVSLEYVFKVQEVQERKMFDFVEPVR